MIESSPEIQTWLQQFDAERRTQAIALLLRLRFVSQDTYSEWLKRELQKIEGAICGLYAVRKINSDSLWDSEGKVIVRPASSLGSEDFVQSVIANFMKHASSRFLDHPSISEIKSTKDFHALLIDDSIGSGERVEGFIAQLFRSKPFRSRWSFGLIRIHIFAFSRSIEAETRILDSIPGSNHGLRIYPKHSKIQFIGNWIFTPKNLESRWGSNSADLVDLCSSIRSIPSNRRQGYGNLMSNVVFYHSIPNNLPGLLWFQNDKWNALFPKRTVPAWLSKLLEEDIRNPTSKLGLPEILVLVLKLIKKGVRSRRGISSATGFACNVVDETLGRLQEAGLLTTGRRLTSAGVNAIRQNIHKSSLPEFDFSLYIPSTWSVDQATVQPVDSSENLNQQKPMSSSSKIGGDVGQASLERTDEKTAQPSLGIIAQNPSAAREGDDAHGPLG